MCIFSELMDVIKEEGRKMSEAQPTETAVGNMIRRSLYFICFQSFYSSAIFHTLNILYDFCVSSFKNYQRGI